MLGRTTLLLRLTPEQRENAKRSIRSETVRKTGDTFSVRDNPLLRGVIVVEMRERGDNIIVPPPVKKKAKENESGRIYTFTSANQMNKKFVELKKLGISFTKIDKRTLVID